jgi:hypothetical protein
MKCSTLKRLATAVGVSLLLFGGCSLVKTQRPPIPALTAAHLKPNEQIAGEIMAYLIEVVLGRAGALEKRDAWSTRGLSLPLDFELVRRRMVGPVPLRAELIVLDTNILGLSRVLYHYDRRLNLFKGTRDHDSLYPCSELMAIRLLLLQKLHRNEKVNIAALWRHAELFQPGSRDAVDSELADMQLSRNEFLFLKAVFQSEPAFLRYMRHPFIVSTLRKIGVAESDAYTLSADRSATYTGLACDEKNDIRPVTIAILPAMNPLFETLPATNQIKPTGEYIQLQNAITSAIKGKFNSDQASPPHAYRLTFYLPDRPVTIHPGNADRVIGQLCPAADFTLILLGKNVYRSLFIDPEADIYPHKNRFYIDVDDVRYHQIDIEIETLVTAVLPAMAVTTTTAPTS